MDKILQIIRGCTNTGKSTIATSLAVYEVSADKYPGIYDEQGKYNVSKQKEAHKWCQKMTEKFMRKDATPIAVHNTFSREWEYRPYVELARRYGYAVQIVHTERLTPPPGKEKYDNGHNVPEEAIDSMLRRWEPVDKKIIPPLEELVKEAIAAKSLMLRAGTRIICDRDGTLARTKSSKTFPVNTEDFELTDFARKLGTVARVNEISIASNQRGVGRGIKQIEAVFEEMNYIYSLLLSQGRIGVNRIAIATRYKANYCWIYTPTNAKSMAYGKSSVDEKLRFDKPGYGMLAIISENNPFVYFGNSPEDWEAVVNYRKNNPETKCAYCPVELIELL